MNCPLCNSDSRLTFLAKELPVNDCNACGHRFAAMTINDEHTHEHFGDEYFFEGGAGYDDYTLEKDILIQSGRNYAKKLSKFTSPGKVLDVGAACGFLLRGFAENDWSCIGIEPNERMAMIGRESLGLDMRVSQFEDFKVDDEFDLIMMIQVAAHFHHPVKAFENAAGLLRSNGYLLIETWDSSSISAKVFGKRWHEYSPPTVLQYYSKSVLDEFLLKMGFAKAASGRPSKKISGGHIRSLLKYRLGDFRALRLIPEKIILPYPSEDLFWALYRKL